MKIEKDEFGVIKIKIFLTKQTNFYIIQIDKIMLQNAFFLPFNLVPSSTRNKHCNNICHVKWYENNTKSSREEIYHFTFLLPSFNYLLSSPLFRQPILIELPVGKNCRAENPWSNIKVALKAIGEWRKGGILAAINNSQLTIL